MKKYADYTFYTNEYHGKITDEQFEAAIVPASAYIKRATLGRSEGSDCEELKYAACAVCDAYASVYLSSDETGGKAVKSENTDGYSVSYALEAPEGTSTENLFMTKASQRMKMYLAGTDLLSRKVGVIP